MSLIGLLAILLGGGTARIAESWLADSEPPRPADLIVVLAGGAEERTSTAIDLYRAGFATAIMITSPEGSPDAEMRKMASEGIPESAFVEPYRPSRSTFEDALSIRQTVLREHVDSLLVITSPFHCRRTRLILTRVLSDLPVRVTLTQSKSLYPRPWWRTVPLEYIKLGWAWLSIPRKPPPRGGRAGQALVGAVYSDQDAPAAADRG